MPRSASARASSSVNGSRCRLRDEALVVPDLEVVVAAENIDLARHARAFAQPRMDEHAALSVELGQLAVVIDAVEEAES